MQKRIISIQGLHCTACEILVENELNNIKGVQKAFVNFKTGTAKIEAAIPVSDEDITRAIKQAGYDVGQTQKLPWITDNQNVRQHLVASGSVLIICSFVFNYFGLFNMQVGHQAASSSLPVIFLIGLTAGFSTCMALIGGLVLGIASKFSHQNKSASSLAKFRPHLLFNIGRIFSYFIFGGLLGVLGSVLTLSSLIIGALTILVALIMFFLGLQLTEISPRLSTLKVTFPKTIASRLGIKQTQNKYSDSQTAILGALTFFLPCGFTQTMQLYALSIADPLRGAMIMGVFALGTTPGLLGIGGLTAFVKGTFAQSFFRFAGVLVIVLSILNFQNGLSLIGFTTQQVKGVHSEVTPSGTNNQIQVLKASYTLDGGMSPSTFSVKSGTPVRLEVDVKENGVGCMSTMLIPGVANSPRYLQAGTTLTFEFTPQKARNFNIVCAMGLPHGIIQAS